MLSKIELDEGALKATSQSVWNIWSDKGPRADEFGALIPLPNGRLAIVPVSEIGFDVEQSTYLRGGHPIFSTYHPDEAILIPYSRDDDSGDSVEQEYWNFLYRVLDRKKNTSRSI